MAPGTLVYEWGPDLEFFGLGAAPGGSVEILPEPGTALLVATGLVLLGVRRHRR